MRDMILLRDVNYFGRVIRRGATFKQASTDSKDWYNLYENNNGVIMHCPSVKLHFTSLTNEFFVEQYSDESPKKQVLKCRFP